MFRFKLYYDKDKEEIWLNEMADKGYRFRSFAAGLYYFEKCQPHTYRYRIDLMDNLREKGNYKDFMAEHHIEMPATWLKWVYLEKETQNGDFNLFSDPQSYAQQYRKIRHMFSLFAGVEILLTLLELLAFVESGEVIFLFFALVLGLLSAKFIQIITSCSRKIKDYEIA